MPDAPEPPPAEPVRDLLPRPEPVAPKPGSAPVQSPLLEDPAFVAAVHAAGAARPDEPGAAKRPGGRPPIIVGMGDAGFLPMLRNFIATSIERHGLRHYLVVALADGMCDGVPTLGGAVTCVKAKGDFKGGDYGSRGFASIVNVKSEVLMAVVRLGYDALLVDGDIVFLQDPLPVLAENNGAGKAPRFDLQIQDDAEAGRNSGFMHVTATPGGLAFIAEAVAVARRNPTIRQQPAVNQAIGSAAAHFRHMVLPTDAFPCGKAYYERPRRMFAYESPCRECVILHNNWIVGTAAKVFRFRESRQWLDDEPDQYYSNASRRYIELGNPAPAVSKPAELAAIRAAFAIGRMLGRAVILPEIRCRQCKVHGLGGTAEGCSGRPGDRDGCMFTAHYGIRELLKGMGQDAFRERMFRYNPLTPTQAPAARDRDGKPVHAVQLAFDEKKAGIEALQASPEGGWTIAAAAPPPDLGSVRPDPKLELKPENPSKGVTEAEILDWFGDDPSPVLRFEHLYGVDPVFASANEGSAFRKAWDASIKDQTLRQY